MSDQQLINEGYMDGKKSFDWHWASIAEQFNFMKIHQAMIVTGWCWKMGEDKNGRERMGIPNLETITNFAHNLLREAYDEDKNISTGGFSAGWDSGEMYLTFTLEEASA